MLAISSNDALVSSNDAACSLAPSASDWLALDTGLRHSLFARTRHSNCSQSLQNLGDAGSDEDRQKIPSPAARVRPTIIVVAAVVSEPAAAAALLAEASVLLFAGVLASVRTASATIPRCLPRSSGPASYPRNWSPHPRMIFRQSGRVRSA